MKQTKYKRIFFILLILLCIISSDVNEKNFLLTNLIKNINILEKSDFKLGFKTSCYKSKVLLYPQFLERNKQKEKIIYKDNIVSLGSVTKQIISFSLLYVIKNKYLNLSLDDDFYKWFPEYKNFKKFRGKNLKIFHLLSMSSGISDYVYDYNFDYFYNINRNKSVSPKQLVDIVKDKKLLFKPGSEFMYSNTNYILIGMLLERIFKKNLTFILQDEIFSPLKLNSMHLNNSINIFNKDISKEDKQFNFTFAYSAGGIASNLSDAQKLIDFIYFDKKTAWYRETMSNKKYCTFRSNFTSGNIFYCLGAIKVEFFDTKFSFIYHNGQVPGEFFYFVVFPNMQASAVVSYESLVIDPNLEGEFLDKIINFFFYKGNIIECNDIN